MKAFFPPALPLFALTLLCSISSTANGAASKRPAPAATPRMEVVFVLDTTSSMSAMIGGAKQKIWAIANKLKSAQPTPEIRFGLIAFRDRGDAYVTDVHNLSTDLDDVYTRLTAFQAEGGGDEPESVNEALACALAKIAWSSNPAILRAIFLVGDSPPHMDYPDDVKWDISCQRARERGILINTLQCGGTADTERVWRQIALRTGGAYAPIVDGGRTTAIETRFDGDIVGLSRAIGETIVPYGTSGERTNAGRTGALLKAMSAESIADRSTYLGRGEFGAVMSGNGDLIVELLAGRLTLETVDAQKLAPELARLPVAERNARIQTLLERRQQLQADLAKLLAQREAAVAEQMKSVAGTDEVVVLSPFEVLAREAEEKGYRFKK